MQPSSNPRGQGRGHARGQGRNRGRGGQGRGTPPQGRPTAGQDRPLPFLKDSPRDGQKTILVGVNCIEGTCDGTFLYSSQAHLNAHLLEVHELERFRCLFPGCQAGFSELNDLSNHVQEHSGEPWPCQKSFTTDDPDQPRPCRFIGANHKKLARHHKEAHHLRLWKCGFPGCTFTSRAQRTVHSHYDRCFKKYLAAQAEAVEEANQTEPIQQEEVKGDAEDHDTGLYSRSNPRAPTSEPAVIGTVRSSCQAKGISASTSQLSSHLSSKAQYPSSLK